MSIPNSLTIPPRILSPLAKFVLYVCEFVSVLKMNSTHLRHPWDQELLRGHSPTSLWSLASIYSHSPPVPFSLPFHCANLMRRPVLSAVEQGLRLIMDFQGDSMVKNPPVNAGDMGLIPESGRCPSEGNGNPLQYSCLGNPMDRGAWQIPWTEVPGRLQSMGLQRVGHDWAHMWLRMHVYMRLILPLRARLG